jgi:hypothetical protein
MEVHMKKFNEWLKEREAQESQKTDTQSLSEKNWIQGAVNPKHKGYCTPMSKPTCTPRRKALAKRFKHGDIHADNVKKDK